jgi:hypothetical protein
MSNVLIGIIGVILFIGLALAGALFLGPRFQQSKNASNAASVMTSLDQMANAASMRRVVTGATGDSGRGQYLVDEGYLKSIPPFVLDPIGGFYNFRDANGAYAGPAAYALAGIDAANPVHLAACREMNRTLRIGDAQGNPPSVATPPGEAGCFLTTGSWGGLPDGLPIVFKRI